MLPRLEYYFKKYSGEWPETKEDLLRIAKSDSRNSELFSGKPAFMDVETRVEQVWEAKYEGKKPPKYSLQHICITEEYTEEELSEYIRSKDPEFICLLSQQDLLKELSCE